MINYLKLSLLTILCFILYANVQAQSFQQATDATAQETKINYNRIITNTDKAAAKEVEQKMRIAMKNYEHQKFANLQIKYLSLINPRQAEVQRRQTISMPNKTDEQIIKALDKEYSQYGVKTFSSTMFEGKPLPDNTVFKDIQINEREIKRFLLIQNKYTETPFTENTKTN